MVKELELVIKEIQKLPEEAQRKLSEEWLSEIMWQVRFQNSETELSVLVNEALGEYKKGKTEDL